nr:unnamed protein product [Callosobruchus chinensis]
MAKLRDANETQKSHPRSPERRLSKGVRFHHDNARPHVSRQTTALLDWKLLDHAPYSRDLAPSDFHLFPKLKQHLGGQRFSTDEEVKEAPSTSAA